MERQILVDCSTGLGRVTAMAPPTRPAAAPHHRTSVALSRIPCQDPFRQSRHLEKRDVPGFSHLPPVPKRRTEAQRIRAVHDHQPLQWVELLGGKAPGNHRPPIMPNQHDTLGACGINQRRHIVRKMRQSIVSDLRGPGGAPVSALIDRPDAIAHSCRYRYLVPPGDGVLRKACRQSANLSPVPSSSTSKRNPLASTLTQIHAMNRSNPMPGDVGGVAPRDVPHPEHYSTWLAYRRSRFSHCQARTWC